MASQVRFLGSGLPRGAAHTTDDEGNIIEAYAQTDGGDVVLVRKIDPSTPTLDKTDQSPEKVIADNGWLQADGVGWADPADQGMWPS